MLFAEWRLVLTGPADGYVNMAIDEATMTLVAERRVPPTVRIYSWDAPCYSVGYLQKIAPIRSDLTSRKDCQCVRRLTGGEAYLHGGDLSYSVVVALSDTLLPADVLSCYERISSGVIEGLRLLGIDSRFAPPVHVHLDNHSIATAAQARREGVLLHQGTISLTPCTLPGGDLLPGQRLSAVSEIVGGVVDLEAGSHALGMGLMSALGVDLSPGMLFAREKRLARQLWREKYITPEWTFAH